MRVVRHLDEEATTRIGTERGILRPPPPIPPEEGSWDDGRAAIGEIRTETRIWFAPPDWLRFESAATAGAATLFSHTTVKAGEVWWTRDTDGRVSTNERDRTGAGGWSTFEEELHVDPAALAATSHLELAGAATWLGRPAVAVHARPRRGPGRMLHAWPWTLLHDDARLLVDAEHGVLLRLELAADGVVLVTSEVVELAFDERIDPGVFAPLR